MTTVHTVLVDSRDRVDILGATSSKYTIRLPNILKRVVSARLISAELPASFYVFRQQYGNTSLNVEVNGVPRTLVIPDGNYTAITMATALRTALAGAYAPWSFDVTLSVTTRKLTFKSLDGYAIVLDTTDATDAPREWGLGYYLGLEKHTTITGTPQLTAPRMANTNPLTYIVLDIAELNANRTIEGGNAPCFAKVPFAANSFQYAFLDASSTSTHPTVYKPPLASLDRLSIAWRFHDGRIIDFFDVEHSFTIEIVTKEPTPHPPPQAPSDATRAAVAAAAAATRVARALEKPPSPPPRPPSPRPQNKTLQLIACGGVLALLFVWMVTRTKRQ